MRLYLVAASMAASFAAPAFAQDTPPPSPSRPGFHVEAVAGFDGASIQGESEGGILYGLGAGYDFHTGHAVLGIQGEVTESTNEGCIRGLVNAADSLCVDQSRDFYIGARAGAFVGRNVLLYAGAGYTNARFEIDYDDGTAGGVNDFSLTDHLDGIRVSGGGELGIGRNAFLRGEYRYSNYEQDGDRHQVVGGFGFRF